MLIHEYRVILPVTVEEYQIASLYTIAHMSREETGGSEGVEVVKNEPFSDYPLMDGKYSSGQYSFKKYHLDKKMPTILRLISPKGSKELHEECWNAYPYCKTVITNPGFMKDDFRLEIITMHTNDRGKEENALQLSQEVLGQREVFVIDIANDPVASNDYSRNTDPKLYRSAKTNRGPLQGDWVDTVTPVMTCYKLVTVHFRWFGLQNKVEKILQNFQRRLYTVVNRKLFCLMDEWYNLTLEDIRKFEEETKAFLNQQRTCGVVTGTVDFT
ncbi:phosphatidylinositol transfer protein alpha isoform-like [Macrosteles quadrilineatus]|uniref:phosphatidylinositol transfer protein alpha isoform-like n=1 Tax=Macrosteles quadrilineatus TaxID=74068 RepID=UPI0023E2877C|nr:phosphatidylinositol transfer protein alpha isoform-like [Macrosteles quadrilineatus]XP_054268703.1 phosphatidylinositol transfer protein alpha isoform-like [Macrosteles quadrilineatus]